jgi:amidase
MAVKRPTLDQLHEVAYSLGIHLSEEQAETYHTLL